MGIAEREEREKETRIIETIMNENFPKFMSHTKTQIQEAQMSITYVEHCTYS